jgi:hypothetical protein
MEEPLDAFLKECGKPNFEVFATRYPHAFLYRDAFVGSNAAKLTDAEVADKTRRFERLVGRQTGYVLLQAGYKRME